MYLHYSESSTSPECIICFHHHVVHAGIAQWKSALWGTISTIQNIPYAWDKLPSASVLPRRSLQLVFERIDKVFGLLWKRERFKPVKELQVLIFLGGLGFSNPNTCLHLITDRPWSDTAGCVQAESTAETNSFATCNTNTAEHLTLKRHRDQVGGDCWFNSCFGNICLL